MNETTSEIHDTVKVTMDEENILRVTFLEAIYNDELNTLQAQAGITQCFNLIEEKGISEPVKVIVDLVPMQSKGHISKNARDMYMKFVSDPRIEKVAVIGSSDAQISIANFVLSFTGDVKSKLSWFSNELEAKYWLKR